MAIVRQTNFSYGEISPSFWGRPEIAAYAGGLRLCQNFVVTKEGSLMLRPGTVMVRQAGSSGTVRLIPYHYSSTQSYILEFGFASGAGYMRVHTKRKTVSSTGGLLEGNESGTPYSLATPYSEDALGEIAFVQSGAVLTLTHKSYTTREVRRISDASWTITERATSRVQFPPDGVSLYSFLHSPETGEHFGYIGIRHEKPQGDANKSPKAWTYKLTALVKSMSDGLVRETAPYTVTRFTDTSLSDGEIPDIHLSPSTQYGTYASGADSKLPLSSEFPATIGMYSDGGLYGGVDDYDRVVAFNIYRGTGDVFGYVGQITRQSFLDEGAEPDYGIQPPGENDLLRVTQEGFDSDTGLWVETTLRTEEPSTVAYHEDRLVFGGTEERPATLFLSATGDYVDFSERFISYDSAPMLLELASRKKENINHVLSAQKLLVFTDSSAWQVGGAGYSPITPTSIDAKVIEEIGASKYVAPISVNGITLYVSTNGRRVRALSFNGQLNLFSGGDFAAYSSHYFSNKAYGALDSGGSITSWAYAAEPFGCVWMTTSNGSLLSATISHDSQSIGWARHTTQSRETASFRSVVSAQGDGEDEVWLVVSRDGVNWVECFSKLSEECHTDASVQKDYLALTGLSHLYGLEVYATGGGGVLHGPYTVGAGVSIPSYTSAVTTMPYVGASIDARIQTLDVGATSATLRQKRISSVGVDVVMSPGGIEIGNTFDNMIAWRSRMTTDAYSSTLTRYSETAYLQSLATWNMGASLCVRQNKPVPTLISGVSREVDVGG